MSHTTPRKATITYAVAMAAGRDAGNRSMKAAGRSAWSEEDWNVAAGVANRLLDAATN